MKRALRRVCTECRTVLFKGACDNKVCWKFGVNVDVQDAKRAGERREPSPTPVIYRGVLSEEKGRVVTIEGGGEPPRPLPPRTDVRPHSRGGFDWGCGSDAAAQLALAICCHALKDDRRAALVHQAFKWELVKGWPREGWFITQQHVVDVVELLEQLPLRQGDGAGAISKEIAF